MQEVGVGDAFRAVNLGPIIHSAEFGPAFLRQSDYPVLELQNENRVVFALSFLLVNLSAHLGEHGLDFRTTDHPAEKLDGVASHVHGDPAAGAPHIPEMRCMGSIMLLGLLQERRLPQRA